MRRARWVMVAVARQQARDRVALALTVLTAPCFVLAYSALFGDTTPPKPALVVWIDGPASPQAQALVDGLSEAADAGDAPVGRVDVVSDREGLDARLEARDAVAALTIPGALGEAFGADSGPALVWRGDASRPTYHLAAAWAQAAVAAQERAALGRGQGWAWRQEAAARSGQRSAFEAYVPGLLVFAVIMLVFGTAITAARAIEAGTLARLRMTPMRPWEWVVGVSAVQVAQGVVSVALTFGVAWLLGFRSAGSLGLALVLGAVACLASVGLGMAVAAVARTTPRAFLTASVVMFALMLFSGVIFPRPQIPLGSIGAYDVDLLDVLPTTHLGAAWDAILVLGAGPSALRFELVALGVVSALYFILGVMAFARTPLDAHAR